MNELTDRTLAGEFEPVQCLEAPELVALPDSLRRSLDGRSVYTRPGSVRYATRVQLSLEERLVANAQRQTDGAADARAGRRAARRGRGRSWTSQLSAHHGPGQRRDHADRACGWIRPRRCSTRLPRRVPRKS